MPALSPSIAPIEPSPFEPLSPAPRECDLPSCPVCFDSMIAAECSAYDDRGVSYLWNCETCGCGFVTKHEATSYNCL